MDEPEVQGEQNDETVVVPPQPDTEEGDGEEKDEAPAMPAAGE